MRLSYWIGILLSGRRPPCRRRIARQDSTSFAVRVEQVEDRVLLHGCSFIPQGNHCDNSSNHHQGDTSIHVDAEGNQWKLKNGTLTIVDGTGSLSVYIGVNPDNAQLVDVYINQTFVQLRNCDIGSVVINASKGNATTTDNLYIDAGVGCTSVVAGIGTTNVTATDASLYVDGACATTSVLNITGGTALNVVDVEKGTLMYAGSDGGTNLISCGTGSNTITTSTNGCSIIYCAGDTDINALGDDIVIILDKTIHTSIVAADGADVDVLITRANQSKVDYATEGDGDIDVYRVW